MEAEVLREVLAVEARTAHVRFGQRTGFTLRERSKIGKRNVRFRTLRPRPSHGRGHSKMITNSAYWNLLNLEDHVDLRLRD